MFNSVRPHRWQPTRLHRPWDSPGNNTGVGCHFLLQCMKAKGKSEVAQSCLTLHDSKYFKFPFPIILKLIPQIILFTVRHSNFFSSWILSLLPLSNNPSSSFNNCLYARYSDIYTLVMNFNCEFTSYFRLLKLSKWKVNQVNKGIICKQLERMARLFWNISKK